MKSGPIKLSPNMRVHLGIVSGWAKLNAEGYELLRETMRHDADARTIVRLIAGSFAPRPEDEFLRKKGYGRSKTKKAEKAA